MFQFGKYTESLWQRIASDSWSLDPGIPCPRGGTGTPSFTHERKFAEFHFCISFVQIVDCLHWQRNPHLTYYETCPTWIANIEEGILCSYKEGIFRTAKRALREHLLHARKSSTLVISEGWGFRSVKSLVSMIWIDPPLIRYTCI